MPSISLTEFVDFVHKSGLPKLNCARQMKEQQEQEYSPGKDFYRIPRQHIVEAHQQGLGKAHLRKAELKTLDPTRRVHFQEIARAYARWWGKKTIGWFLPPKDKWVSGGTEVRVNPELGLELGSKPHLVKLYFKKPALKQPHADLILELMTGVLGDSADNAAMALLDVRRGKLFQQSPKAKRERLRQVLPAEAAYLNALWPTL